MKRDQPSRSQSGSRTTWGIATDESRERYLTPPEVAKLLRVSQQKVLGWIPRAELRAVNVGNGMRPQYRVSREWLDMFLEAREVHPPSNLARRVRRPSDGRPIDPVLGEQLLKKKQAIEFGGTYYRIWNGGIQFV
jgi:excisionase family DNA binding protein